MSTNLPPNILNEFADCALFNTVGSIDGCTHACDWDHVGKRTRERIKSSLGIRIRWHSFQKTNLAYYMKYAGINSSPEEAELLLNPQDAMDVYEMVLCLQAVAMFCRIPFDNYDVAFKREINSNQVFRELRLLGHIVHCMAVLIIGHETAYKGSEIKPHLSITELLTFASMLSHLLFTAYRLSTTAFLANQNYRHWQDTIKSLYVSVAMHKIHNIHNYWWFLDSSKRLEQFFGILRSMIGGDLNFNVAGLKERMADAAAIARIYAQKPEWDTVSRKLHSSYDRKNVRSWNGDTDVRNVNIPACWRQGRERATLAIQASRVCDDENEYNYDEIGQTTSVDVLRLLE